MNVPVLISSKYAPGGQYPPIEIGPNTESVTDTPVRVTLPVLVMTNLNIGSVVILGPGGGYLHHSRSPRHHRKRISLLLLMVVGFLSNLPV